MDTKYSPQFLDAIKDYCRPKVHFNNLVGQYYAMTYTIPMHGDAFVMAKSKRAAIKTYLTILSSQRGAGENALPKSTSFQLIKIVSPHLDHNPNTIENLIENFKLRIGYLTLQYYRDFNKYPYSKYTERCPGYDPVNMICKNLNCENCYCGVSFKEELLQEFIAYGIGHIPEFKCEIAKPIKAKFPHNTEKVYGAYLGSAGSYFSQYNQVFNETLFYFTKKRQFQVPLYVKNAEEKLKNEMAEEQIRITEKYKAIREERQQTEKLRVLNVVQQIFGPQSVE